MLSEQVEHQIHKPYAGKSSPLNSYFRYVRYGINMHAVELNELPQVKTAARLF